MDVSQFECLKGISSND